MGQKLYVGNLSYNTTSSDLEQLFSQHGTVQSAEVISDRDSGRSKGFGFVEMGSDEEAQAAIPAGEWSFEDAMDDDGAGGGAVTLRAVLRTGGGRAVVDLHHCLAPSQLAGGRALCGY